MPELAFHKLVELCRSTHAQLQGQAARSIDLSLVVRNWLFGWYIVEFEGGGAERAELYGKRLVERLASELKASGLKGTSPTNLRKCREFYRGWGRSLEIQQTVSVESPATKKIQQTASVESPSTAAKKIQQTASVESPSTAAKKIQQTLSVESFRALMATPNRAPELPAELFRSFRLGWSHYVTLLTLSNPDERRFYEIEAAASSWSVRELERQINSALYERLALSRDKVEIRELAEQGVVVQKAADVIKNPFVLEFLGLHERSSYSERELETAIIDKLEQFLLELGKGFLFEARQQRFTFDNDHFYVDLVFYNRLLRCYVLIDLKIDKLRHQDLGQMQMYVNHFDRHVKLDDEAPTIGILLCHRKNDAVVELTLPEDSNIYASKYQLYLPSKAELRQKLLDWSEEAEGG